MTQQVIHCRVICKSRDAEVDDSSFGFTFEATGSDTDFTFDDTSPVAALLKLMDGTTTYVQNGFTPPFPANGWYTYISTVMSRNSGDLTVTTTDITAHLDGSAAGPPLRIDTTTLGAVSGTGSLPEGVSAGVSWRANYGRATEFGPGTRPRSRYGNRCYVGPLANNTTAVITTDSTGASRLSVSFLQADLMLGLAVLSGNNTDTPNNHKQWDLVAWSRRDAMVRDAELGAISERFDYQRRRTERLT